VGIFHFSAIHRIYRSSRTSILCNSRSLAIPKALNQRSPDISNDQAIPFIFHPYLKLRISITPTLFERSAKPPRIPIVDVAWSVVMGKLNYRPVVQPMQELPRRITAVNRRGAERNDALGSSI
jgi:hypothetical protein